MKRPPVVSFWYESPPDRMPSYVRHDWDTLRSFTDVRWHAVEHRWRRGFGPTGWLPTKATLRAVRESDVVLLWFATVSAPILAARLLRKPAIVVSGGYDVAREPAIGYGRMLLRRTRWMTRLALTAADLVVCPSRFNQEEVRRCAPAARARLLYHGFDTHAFPLGLAKKPRVITVGAITDDYVARKGLDTFARASRLLPDVEFTIVGRIVEPHVARRLQSLGSDRLELTDYVPDQALVSLLQESAVYAQLSVHEAFGCAVAEAMLCGCTAVVSDRGALAEVVGDTGFYVPAGNPEAAAAAITRALGVANGARSRERIAREYPLSRRQDGLRRHVAELLGR